MIGGQQLATLITNKEKLLSEVMDSVLPYCDNVYFLVGYFFFSGFEEIFEGLKDKNIKILVGMDIERDFMNRIKEYELLSDIEGSRETKRENYYKTLVEFFNETDYFDTSRKQEAFKIYLEKIREGTLQIRKTDEPNHAKVYLFEHRDNQAGTFPGTLITGSSNLTFSGLKGRHEFDVILRDDANYKDAKNIFDELWDRSIDIASIESKDLFEKKVVQKIWLDKLPSPYLVYLRVLDEYFSVQRQDGYFFPAEITNNRYYNLKYQIDAISQALSIIEKHNGVIISDVVGLGKSIVASSVAHALRLKTVIIAPPHLMDQWEDYRMEFDFNARVYSSGKISDALIMNAIPEEKLIIIDEAHRYRNELTQDYANLHKLCQGNKVMLLTATPYNNKPQDVFALIKLFQIPTRSTLQTVDNLSLRFEELIKEYKEIERGRKKGEKDQKTLDREIKAIATKIRNLISPFMIRRSRIDLQSIEAYRKDLEAQGIIFPEVKDPELLEYEFDDLTELYKWTLNKIAPEDEKKGFIGTRYKPVAYLKNIDKYKKFITKQFGDERLFRQSQLNMASFMRRHLVRRFESSIKAFQISLDIMIKSSEIILGWFDKAGLVPIFKKGNIPDVDQVLGNGSLLSDEVKEYNEAQFEELRQKGYVFIPAKEISVNFRKDLIKDIELLKEIRDKWFGNGFPEDPKLKHFEKIVKELLQKDPKRKIVVFSEFADTANYLYEELKDRLRIFKYSAADATKENKRIIHEEFDASSKKRTNNYDILIATDAISEGFNLNRAGTIFNYDIPYNPTRVIQRVGRINRINKKVFDELYIYNFFPTETGEAETRIKQISTLKFAMINAVLGEDTKILTSDEELKSYFVERYKKAFKESEEKSWDVEYRDLLERIKATKPELLEKAREIPKRARIRRTTSKDKKGVIVFGKKGNNHIFKFANSPENSVALNGEEALELFKALPLEEPQAVSTDFENIYQSIKESLFLRKNRVPMNRGERDAVKVIDYLKENCPAHRDYLEDLRKVVVDYRALPEAYEKLIRNLDTDDTKIIESIKFLKKEIPHEYLESIISRANSISEQSETIIISEELI